jgi:hypothetical protein
MMSTFRRIDSLLDGRTSDQLAREVAARERGRVHPRAVGDRDLLVLRPARRRAGLVVRDLNTPIQRSDAPGADREGGAELPEDHTEPPIARELVQQRAQAAVVRGWLPRGPFPALTACLTPSTCDVANSYGSN